MFVCYSQISHILGTINKLQFVHSQFMRESTSQVSHVIRKFARTPLLLNPLSITYQTPRYSWQRYFGLKEHLEVLRRNLASIPPFAGCTCLPRRYSATDTSKSYGRFFYCCYDSYYYYYYYK